MLAQCPRCKRLDLNLLGWHKTGELDVCCRACGTSFRMKRGGGEGAPEDNGHDGASETRPVATREELEPLWQKALANYTEKDQEGARGICMEILEKDPSHPIPTPSISLGPWRSRATTRKERSGSSATPSPPTQHEPSFGSTFLRHFLPAATSQEPSNNSGKPNSGTGQIHGSSSTWEKLF